MLDQRPETGHGACVSAPVTDPGADEDAPRYEVTEFTFSDHNTDSEFVVMCNGSRLVIRLLEDHFSDSSQLKEQYLFFLKVAEEGELDGQTVDDFQDWVIEPFLPVLRSLSGQDAGAFVEPTLHDFFFAETLVYTLVIAAGELSPSLCETTKADKQRIGLGIALPADLCSAWQCFQPSDLAICAENPDEALARLPKKVKQVGGLTLFFLKLLRPGDQHSAKRELTTYRKISEAVLDPETRISRLHGLVRDERGVVFGLLLTYINCRARTLACAVKPHIPIALRHKWKNQVCSTVEVLHKAGVIWGDVKADNVLIDEYDDAWVIDFGGGYTEGWVKKQSAGTLTGDAEGLANILKFIGD
ncbi:hypothetical protein VDGD_05279 [Verticillium dahliae]|uniref:Protein kinase domain-containing protein n=1 Tax=Verticillium dahliae (strain VdLs.17 / ATCC MYA-4575 / FGSC 10137) TaxID=498257 RepID=G2X547_VERDV|nr:uncharacterized protein VDAG_05279 [Verticillium dahliae VdLs.17]KAF3344252.1 Pre-mRNA-splicing factor 38A [Verticillium dahliae VDG2]KAF3359925.1 Siderophore iron transporter mirB [Verticillium dahliae VDG1]KAH6699494.1 hypothetical protein EV126DRAFT_423988 [Verticillium dahliae]EGY23841.1 hypothetical protein VDAG_05279 [Verticillium dahliae VdLs.17]RBQ66921.1 hypothetical protein VDGD_05279 [Verticillium dahliae]